MIGLQVIAGGLTAHLGKGEVFAKVPYEEILRPKEDTGRERVKLRCEY